MVSLVNRVADVHFRRDLSGRLVFIPFTPNGHLSGNRHTVAVHYIYDPNSDQWTESIPLPFPREHFNLIALSGKLYAMGGRIENYSQNVATVFSLDLHEKTVSGEPYH